MSEKNEKANARSRKWYNAHKEEIKERRRLKRLANRDEYNEKARKYKAEHPEQIKETKERFYANHLNYSRERWLKQKEQKLSK